MSKTLLTDEIVNEQLEQDGIMVEPDAPWLLEYINENYGGSLDTTTDWNDSNHMLKIYSETTYDGYDIYWCTFDEKPYVSQDGYYYEDHSDWSEKVIDEITSGSDAWVEPHLWDDMEWEFNHSLTSWWSDVFEEKFNEKKDELLDSGDYYEEDEE
jgi:hypothetical protein